MKKCNQCGLLLDSDVKICRKCGTNVSRVDDIYGTTFSGLLKAVGVLIIICGFILGIVAFSSFEENISLYEYRYIAMFVIWISSLVNSLIFLALGNIIHNQKIIVTGMGYEEEPTEQDNVA